MSQQGDHYSEGNGNGNGSSGWGGSSSRGSGYYSNKWSSSKLMSSSAVSSDNNGAPPRMLYAPLSSSRPGSHKSSSSSSHYSGSYKEMALGESSHLSSTSTTRRLSRFSSTSGGSSFGGGSGSYTGGSGGGAGGSYYGAPSSSGGTTPPHRTYSSLADEASPRLSASYNANNTSTSSSYSSSRCGSSSYKWGPPSSSSSTGPQFQPSSRTSTDYGASSRFTRSNSVGSAGSNGSAKRRDWRSGGSRYSRDNTSTNNFHDDTEGTGRYHEHRSDSAAAWGGSSSSLGPSTTSRGSYHKSSAWGRESSEPLRDASDRHSTSSYRDSYASHQRYSGTSTSDANSQLLSPRGDSYHSSTRSYSQSAHYRDASVGSGRSCVTDKHPDYDGSRNVRSSSDARYSSSMGASSDRGGLALSTGRGGGHEGSSVHSSYKSGGGPSDYDYADSDGLATRVARKLAGRYETGGSLRGASLEGNSSRSRSHEGASGGVYSSLAAEAEEEESVEAARRAAASRRSGSGSTTPPPPSAGRTAGTLSSGYYTSRGASSHSTSGGSNTYGRTSSSDLVVARSGSSGRQSSIVERDHRYASSSRWITEGDAYAHGSGGDRADHLSHGEYPRSNKYAGDFRGSREGASGYRDEPIDQFDDRDKRAVSGTTTSGHRDLGRGDPDPRHYDERSGGRFHDRTSDARFFGNSSTLASESRSREEHLLGEANRDERRFNGTSSRGSSDHRVSYNRDREPSAPDSIRRIETSSTSHFDSRQSTGGNNSEQEEGEDAGERTYGGLKRRVDDYSSNGRYRYSDPQQWQKKLRDGEHDAFGRVDKSYPKTYSGSTWGSAQHSDSRKDPEKHGVENEVTGDFEKHSQTSAGSAACGDGIGSTHYPAREPHANRYGQAHEESSLVASSSAPSENRGRHDVVGQGAWGGRGIPQSRDRERHDASADRPPQKDGVRAESAWSYRGPRKGDTDVEQAKEDSNPIAAKQEVAVPSSVPPPISFSSSSNLGVHTGPWHVSSTSNSETAKSAALFQPRDGKGQTTAPPGPSPWYRPNPMVSAPSSNAADSTTNPFRPSPRRTWSSADKNAGNAHVVSSSNNDKPVVRGEVSGENDGESRSSPMETEEAGQVDVKPSVLSEVKNASGSDSIRLKAEPMVAPSSATEEVGSKRKRSSDVITDAANQEEDSSRKAEPPLAVKKEDEVDISSPPSKRTCDTPRSAASKVLSPSSGATSSTEAKDGEGRCSSPAPQATFKERDDKMKTSAVETEPGSTTAPRRKIEGSKAANEKTAPAVVHSTATTAPVSTSQVSSQEVEAAKEVPSELVPPDPVPPSGYALALSRLAELTAQMEYQYAKQLKLSIEHEIIKAKIRKLESLPVGIDAIREDLDRLEDQKKAEAAAAAAKGDYVKAKVKAEDDEAFET